MTNINRLAATDAISNGDLVPVWSSNNSDTRRVSVAKLGAAIQALIEEDTVAGVTQEVLDQLTLSDGSSHIGFIQAGAGAVARTVQSKERDWVNVRDFGAVGNGVTNDAPAIQAAITLAASLGGAIVLFPPGTYATSSTIEISSSNIMLMGMVAGSGVESYPGAPTQPAVTIKPTATVGIRINGPVTGFGIQNIGVVFATTVASSIGIHNKGGNQGDCRNLYVFNAQSVGILDETTPTWPGEHNSWANVHVLMTFPATAAAVGIKVTGDAVGGDRYYDVWTNVIITPTHTGQTALHLGYCDSLTFTNIEIKPIGCKGIVFDYTINNGMPNNVVFFNLDVYDNTVTNVGTPLIPTAENRVFGFSTGNGAPVPHIKGLRIMDVPFFSRTKMYLNSAQNIGNAGTQVTLNATEVDLDSIANTGTGRITPYRTGTYKVTAQVMAASSVAGSQVIATILKNGFVIEVGKGFALNGGGQAGAFATGYVTLDGVADYVMLAGQVTGGSTAIQTGANQTYLMLEGPI